MATPESPVRRVLGDKPTNAPIRKHSPSKPIKNASQGSSLLTASSSNRAPTMQSDNASTSPRAGQKRRIDEVEDAERVDWSEPASQRSDRTQVLSLLSDGSSEAGEMSMDATEGTKSTNATSALSFAPSQPESGPMETTFEIHEEVMSQNSRDQLVRSETFHEADLMLTRPQHAIVLPQNASQPQGLRPSLTKDHSQLSVGMSSFLNFDQTISSQDDSMEPIKRDDTTERHSDDHAAPGSEKSRRETMDAVRSTDRVVITHADIPKQAERLRTRLQLAFFKVQTNQATVPFSRLRTHSRSKTPELPAEPRSSSPFSSPPATHRPSPETRIAIMRARATMQEKRAVKPLSSLSFPKIVPTAYSARQMNESASESQQIPSSPPLSRQSDSRSGSAELSKAVPTPHSKHTAAHQPPLTPMQLSSPPGSPERSKKLTTTQKLKRQEKEARYNGLTSSVIKGDAANSLLDLMKGSQRDEE